MSLQSCLCQGQGNATVAQKTRLRKMVTMAEVPVEALAMGYFIEH